MVVGLLYWVIVVGTAYRSGDVLMGCRSTFSLSLLVDPMVGSLCWDPLVDN